MKVFLLNNIYNRGKICYEIVIMGYRIRMNKLLAREGLLFLKEEYVICKDIEKLLSPFLEMGLDIL